MLFERPKSKNKISFRYRTTLLGILYQQYSLKHKYSLFGDFRIKFEGREIVQSRFYSNNCLLIESIWIFFDFLIPTLKKYDSKIYLFDRINNTERLRTVEFNAVVTVLNKNFFLFNFYHSLHTNFILSYII